MLVAKVRLETYHQRRGQCRIQAARQAAGSAPLSEIVAFSFLGTRDQRAALSRWRFHSLTPSTW